MSWEPRTSAASDVHVAAVTGVQAFPPGRSSVDRAAIQQAFQRAGMKAKGPTAQVGIDVVDDDGQPTKMILVFTPGVAAALIAAIESVGAVDRSAVHAARAQLARRTGTST